MVLYLDVVMDEEEVLSIFNDLTKKNPPFPYWKFDKIEVQFKDNGHKRVHCLRFQSVVPPNGMIANLFGPIGESIGLIS